MSLVVLLRLLNILNQFKMCAFHDHFDLGEQTESCIVPYLVSRVDEGTP